MRLRGSDRSSSPEESLIHTSEEENAHDDSHVSKPHRQPGPCLPRGACVATLLPDTEASDSETHLTTPTVFTNGLSSGEAEHGGERDSKLDQSHADAQEEVVSNASGKPQVSHLGKRKRKGWKVAKTQETPNTPEILTPPLVPDNGQVSTPRGSPSPEKNGTGGILKRLPGRRRAPHADPHVEAKLRRQLELKVSYRAVAKAQKLILAELARRTAEELEANVEAHKEYEEYEEITEQLQLRLNERLEILERSFDEEEARLKREMLAQEHIIKERYRQKVVDSQDNRLLESQHGFLASLRSMAVNDDSDATEDEDGIVPPLYTVRAPDFERKPISSAYDSRSRFYIRTQKLWDGLESRFRMRQAQQKFDPTSLVVNPKDFATVDWKQRDIATAAWNLDVLIDAAKNVDEETSKVDLNQKHDAATALQALAAQIPVLPAKIETPKEIIKRERSISSRETPSEHPQSHYVYTPGSEFILQDGPSKDTKPTTSVPKVPMVGGRPLFASTPPRALTSSSLKEIAPLPLLLAPTSMDLPQSTINNDVNVPFWQGPPPPLPPHFHNPQPPLPAPSVQHRNGEQPIEMPRATEINRPTSRGEPKVRADPLAPPLQIVNHVPVKPRNRPGPKAVYAPAGGYGVPQVQNKHWSPFSNSMGPPMYSMPKYMQDPLPQRRTSMSGNNFGPPPLFSDFYPSQQLPPQPPSDSTVVHDHHRKDSGGRGSGFQSIAPAWPPLHDANMQQRPHSSQNIPQQQYQPPTYPVASMFHPGNIPPPQDAHRRDYDPSRPPTLTPMHMQNSFQHQGPPQQPYYPPRQSPSFFQQQPQDQAQPQMHHSPQQQQSQSQGMNRGQLGPHGQASLNRALPRYQPTEHQRPISPRQYSPRRPSESSCTAAPPQQQGPPPHRNSLAGYGQKSTVHTHILPANLDPNRRDREIPPNTQRSRQNDRPQRPPHTHNNGHQAHPSQSYSVLPPLQAQPQQSSAQQQRSERAFSSSKPSVASLLQTPQPAAQDPSRMVDPRRLGYQQPPSQQGRNR